MTSSCSPLRGEGGGAYRLSGRGWGEGRICVFHHAVTLTAAGNITPGDLPILVDISEN